MNVQQKNEYQQRVEAYLAKESVYDLFEDLLKSLVVRQPDDPLAFLIDKLTSGHTKRIFIVGPPGLRVREFALQVADHYKFTTISVGDLLRKEVSKKLQLGEEIQAYFKSFTLVRDDIVINIVKKEIQALQKEKKSLILSGFPKTRAQGLSMQRAGIFPDAFIVLNVAQQASLLQLCDEKFKTFEKIMDKGSLANRAQLVKNHAMEYSLNIRQIKEIYSNNYFQVNCLKANREEVLEDIARLLKFKIKPKRPKRPAGIVLVGGTRATRLNVGAKIARRYGFVLVCTRDLLSEQVSRSTEVGRLALEKIKQNALIDDNIINGLVQNRVRKVDCQMQGYVLEGYPRTASQIAALKDSYLQPSLIVLLDGGDKKYPLKEIAERYPHCILKFDASNS